MRKWSVLFVAGSAAAALLVGVAPAKDAGPGQDRAINLADVRPGF